MKQRSWAGLCGAVCVTSFATVAGAQSIERFALGLDTGLFSVQSESVQVGGALGKVDTSTTNFGIGAGGFGLNLGSGVSENVFLGLQLLLTSTSQKAGETEAQQTLVTLQPRAEYVFGSDSFRPAISLLVGYHSNSVTATTGLDASWFSFGAGLGAHAFVTDSFSIDPLLSFQGLSGSRSSGGGESVDSTGSLIAFTVAFTGWIGGSPERRAGADGAESADGAVGTTQPSTKGAAAVAAGGDGGQEDVSELKVTVELPDYHQLVLFARPSMSKSVKVTLIERGTSSELRECRDLALVADPKKFTLAKVTLVGRKVLRMTAHYVAEAFTQPEALASLATSPQASVQICDKSWKVPEESQKTIREFLEQYREMGGVYEEPAPPSPPPAVIEGSGATPPVAEPAPTDPPLSASPAPAPTEKPPKPAAPSKPNPAGSAKPSTPAPARTPAAP